MAILEPTAKADTLGMMQSILSPKVAPGAPVGLVEGTEHELVGTLEQMRKIRDNKEDRI